MIEHLLPTPGLGAPPVECGAPSSEAPAWTEAGGDGFCLDRPATVRLRPSAEPAAQHRRHDWLRLRIAYRLAAAEARHARHASLPAHFAGGRHE